MIDWIPEPSDEEGGDYDSTEIFFVDGKPILVASFNNNKAEWYIDYASDEVSINTQIDTVLSPESYVEYDTDGSFDPNEILAELIMILGCAENDPVVKPDSLDFVAQFIQFVRI
jgi:hypothetical protein